jgi:hypothetical protein
MAGGIPAGTAAAVLAAWLAAMAAAQEPLGPPFGDNTYRSAIRDDGAVDVDDFVGPLVAGETLTVTVAAEGDRALLPGLALFDPAGAERTPPLRLGAGGARAAIRRFPVDRTGRWVVRVLGRDESEGAYRVRFRVGRCRTAGRARCRFPAGAARVEVRPFEAVRGSTLSLRLRPAGASRLPRLLEVLDPAGRAVPGAAALLDRRGGLLVLQELPLDGPDGTWRLVLGLDPGEALDAALRVRPPRRPRDAVDLDPAEPCLDPLPAPLEGTAGGLLRLRGRNLSAAPRASVRLGGLPAETVGAGPGEEYLDVILPGTPSEGALDVAVVNPDGQAWSAPGVVRVLPRGASFSLGLFPRAAEVAPGGRVAVRVRLGGPAPPEGAVVALSVEGVAATLPASVALAPYAYEAVFEVTAGTAPGAGRVVATWNGTASLALRVLGPDAPTEIDLSGWSLVQTSSARTFILPEGTRLHPGGTVVVARKSARAAFEAFWGVTLGSEVVYFDSGDTFPSLNGAETFSLADPAGHVVDGPTVALVAGRAYRRKPGEPAGADSSWDEGVAVPGAADPGVAPEPAGAGLYVSEIADPGATGAFVYEFVEVCWDP